MRRSTIWICYLSCTNCDVFHIPREVGAELKTQTLPHLRLRIDLQVVRNTRYQGYYKGYYKGWMSAEDWYSREQQ